MSGLQSEGHGESRLRKGVDDGVVVVVAPTERKMRIEVGYGLEGVLNDSAAGRSRWIYASLF